jgi:hypothetical protein
MTVMKCQVSRWAAPATLPAGSSRSLGIDAAAGQALSAAGNKRLPPEVRILSYRGRHGRLILSTGYRRATVANAHILRLYSRLY